MAQPTPFVQYVCEGLSALGQVGCRPMFGGWGLYVDGRFCAIVHRDTLYLKTDAVTRGDFEARGCAPFKPFADRSAVLAYHEAPAEVFEDAAEMLAWGRKGAGCGASRREQACREITTATRDQESRRMNKAFTKETDAEEDEPDEVPALPPGTKNYITPAGFRRLKDEALLLLDKERPELVKVVQWAASNGDRSENADYIYGKRRLREIDRRIRFLTKRLDAAVVVDPAAREETDQVFFGATVRVVNQAGEEKTYSIVGIDEADVSNGRISWISPLARALLKAREGDTVTVRTPGGDEALDIVSVEYKSLDA